MMLITNNPTTSNSLKRAIMFKYTFTIGLLLCGWNAFAQSDTQIYLFDIIQDQDSLVLKNGKNISQNPGYNNQPSFYDNEQLLYSRNKNGQTDIAVYNVKNATTRTVSKTAGSEFSPLRIRDTDKIAAVRLDTSGLQRLYQYSLKDTAFAKAISPHKIGYFDFYDQDRLLASVLTPMAMDLYVINLKTEKDSLIIRNVGRSIHKVPGMQSMSYTLVNEDQELDLYLLDMDGLESFFVCALPIGIQDYTWLNKEQLILGSRDKLYIYGTLRLDQWTEITDLKKLGIKNITRIAVSPDGQKLALVAEKAP